MSQALLISSAKEDRLSPTRSQLIIIQQACVLTLRSEIMWQDFISSFNAPFLTGAQGRCTKVLEFIIIILLLFLGWSEPNSLCYCSWWAYRTG